MLRKVIICKINEMLFNIETWVVYRPKQLSSYFEGYSVKELPLLLDSFTDDQILRLYTKLITKS